MSWQYWAFDKRQPDVLASEVFAPRFRRDYKALLGGSVEEVSNQEQVDAWMKWKDYTTASKHCLSYVFDSHIGICVVADATS